MISTEEYNKQIFDEVQVVLGDQVETCEKCDKTGLKMYRTPNIFHCYACGNTWNKTKDETNNEG